MRQLLDLLGDLHAVDDLPAFRSTVARGLRTVVPAAHVSFVEIAADTSQVVTHPAMGGEPGRRFRHLVPRHPVLERIRRTGDGRPVRLSDVVEDEALRRSALHREVLLPLGLAAQVGFALAAGPGLTVVVLLSRGGRDFTGQEVALLGYVRRHLIQAYRGAQASMRTSRMLAVLAQGLDVAAEGVLVATPSGEIASCTPAARASLALADDTTTLPRALLAQLALLSPGSRTTAVRVGDGRSVPVRAIGEADGLRVLIVERSHAPSPNVGDLQERGLTAREAETLARSAHGSSRDAIASAMGISTRTVDKHLQMVYAKLGVRSRTEAVAAAWRPTT